MPMSTLSFRSFGNNAASSTLGRTCTSGDSWCTKNVKHSCTPATSMTGCHPSGPSARSSVKLLLTSAEHTRGACRTVRCSASAITSAEHDGSASRHCATRSERAALHANRSWSILLDVRLPAGLRSATQYVNIKMPLLALRQTSMCSWWGAAPARLKDHLGCLLVTACAVLADFQQVAAVLCDKCLQVCRQVCIALLRQASDDGCETWS